MANFNSKNKASRTARRWFTDIDINMASHPDTNDLVLKYDINAIKRSLKNLLQTNHYERPFKPSLGLNLRGMLFELDGAHTTVLKGEIIELINAFEPRCNVRNLTLTSIGNTLNVMLHVTIMNNPRPYELDLILERVR